MKPTENDYSLRIHKFVNCCLILFVFACCDENKTDNVLDSSKMTEILQEIYLLENHYQMKYGAPSIYKPYLDSSCLEVLSKHGLSKEDFVRSFDYYSARPEEFMKIQKAIKSNLERQR